MLRKFDINNPWTKSEMDKHNKYGIRNTVVLCGLLFALNCFAYLQGLYIIPEYPNVDGKLLGSIYLIVALIGLFKWASYEKDFSTLSVYGYKKLLKLKQENDIVKEYIKKISKQNRELLYIEFCELQEELKIEKKNKLKQEVYNT